MNIHKSITFNSLFFRKDSAAAESSAGAEKNESRKATKPTEEGTIAAILPRDKEASLAVDAINKFDLLRFMGRDAGAPFWWAASRLLHFQIDKSSQVLRIHIGDSPERESLMIPMPDIIAVFSEAFRCSVSPRCRRPDKQVNNM